MALTDTLRPLLAPPHPAGRPFIVAGVAAIVAGVALSGGLAWLGVIFTLFCFFFFRDPDRVPPGRTGIIVAPADGIVVSITPAAPPAELALGEAPRWRISTHLSLIDVHVNRIPVDGTVARIAYRHGSFINADLDKASEQNERNAIAIRVADGREIAVVQIAGFVARRIVCDVREGEPLMAGARFGIIRFGSRVDVYLPDGVRPLVAVGQTMIGGETVIADLSG